MNPLLTRLQAYPFEKLQQLKSGVVPPEQLTHIALSIGEPKHLPPGFVLKTLSENLDRLANYPTTKGLSELREAIAGWLERRFKLPAKIVDANENVLPVNGTREALFAIAQACIDSSQKDAKVLMPNPFYQIYEGAALLAGAEPVFLNCTKENNFHPDFSQVDEKTWQQCQLLYLCTPGNPTGAVLPLEKLKELIALSEQHDFIIASDECYSELYFDEQSPPAGLLQACAEMDICDFKNCLVFHSLSKRSNLPGLRSGFVAGDKNLINTFFKYRTYHGCAMPIPTQLASIAVWNDETHVLANRSAYREKFERVLHILDGCLALEKPDAGFYLWPETAQSDTEFAQKLYAEKNITVLPGSFLARETLEGNPGKQRVRMALVASLDECEQAALRIREFCGAGN
ncbi:succinyldiaminopimelate aminotransferase apoenzyme [Alteromonadaceae bacterium Bs31]|nr:succinyldiaminopimelate aminotransferase apoenzyme [Alteromonadaceae bacterium Bs31]